ncbi:MULTISPECIES: hypothetical protein [unclassified Frondihabitans]|uniref:hypothetical protein n=1 Tax=unclassified Frondihabitans TaxID=2626248 RepID=UPI000F4FFAF6|nr:MULTISPECIES: hypothetical protein [unclassified Frondihabitans]RPE78964.1 hypothetical protein EDF37_1652 [Frondihabitans sp. PhB153]RPF09245.1 hypothetical protein EDF39_1654 [Frondihabitans sp. PhB161]
MSDIRDTVSAINSAMSANRPEDVITGVKTAVADQLSDLDRDSEIVFTEYFNHSYVPDMVIRWREQGKKKERRVYLRTSLTEMVLGDEPDALAGLEPVLLGLRKEETPAVVEEARDVFSSSPRAFVTEIGAFADLGVQKRLNTSSRQTSSGRTSSPLLELVSSSLLRGGKGVLTESDSQALVLSGNNSDESQESLDEFQSTIDSLFLAPAASRLHDAVRLIRLGLSGNLVELPALEETRGLSNSELRVLLPFLLQDERITTDERYWAAVGALMDLKRLEEIADGLVGLDLTPLVAANARSWKAARSQVVARVPEAEVEVAAPTPPVEVPVNIEGVSRTFTIQAVDAPSRSSSSSDEPVVNAEGWHIRAQRLAAHAGEWTLFVTADQRRLKGRDSEGSGRWDTLKPMLESFVVQSVELRGLSRSVSVQGESSNNVFQDVARIRDTIQDDFHVPHASIRLVEDEEDASAKVDFGAMTVSSSSAPLDTVVRAAGLLAHAAPILEERMDELLRGTER